MTSDQHSDNNMYLSGSAWAKPGKRCHKACPQGWATWWTNSALLRPRQFLREPRPLKSNFAWIPCKMEQCFGRNRPDPVACTLDLLLPLEVSLQYVISSSSFIPGAAQDRIISSLFMRRKKAHKVSLPLFKAYKYLKQWLKIILFSYIICLCGYKLVISILSKCVWGYENTGNVNLKFKRLHFLN